MSVGLENLIEESHPFGGSSLSLSSGSVGEKGLLILVSDGTGCDSNKIIRTGCILVLGQGVRVGKETGEPPTSMTTKESFWT